MLEFFMSPAGVGIIVCLLILFMTLLIIKRMKPGREVMYLRERDRRGQRFIITEETAKSITCGSKRGLTKRFWKWGGSYVFNEHGKMITRFFGKEGTAYTYRFESAKPGIENPENLVEMSRTEEIQCLHCGKTFEWEMPIVQVGEKGKMLGTLSDATRVLWGEKFYGEIPEEQRKMLDESKICVTVELEPGFTPEDLPPITEEEIEEEQDREAAKIFGKGLGASAKQQLYQGMLWMALGALIVFVMFNFGVFT